MTNAIRSTKSAAPACAMGLLLSAVLMAAGCAGKPVELGNLYQRLGSEAGVADLANDIMQNVGQDPRIKEPFAKANGPNFTQMLANRICEIGSGPCTDDGESMPAALRALALSNQQFDAFIGDFAKALDAHGVGPDSQRKLLFPFKAMRGDALGMTEGS